MRNIFLDKSSVKCDGEASHRPFYKKSILSISLDFLKCYEFVLIVFLNRDLLKYIRT